MKEKVILTVGILGLTALVSRQAVDIEKMSERERTQTTTIERYAEAHASVSEELLETMAELDNVHDAYSAVTDTGWVMAEGVVTAYSPFDNVSGIECDGDPNSTSTGVTPGPGKIAVDPERIPYGSYIVIVYKDGTTEQGVAVDTGGAMRSADDHLIDVFRHTYDETVRHGRKDAAIFWKPKEETQ